MHTRVYSTATAGWLLAFALLFAPLVCTANPEYTCPPAYELQQKAKRWVCVKHAVETFTSPAPCPGLQIDQQGNKDLCQRADGKTASPKCPPGFRLEHKSAKDRCKKRQREEIIPAEKTR